MSDLCLPDPCNKKFGASGEVCVAGKCNCGSAPCTNGKVCKSGRCGIFINQTNLIISSLKTILNYQGQIIYHFTTFAFYITFSTM